MSQDETLSTERLRAGYSTARRDVRERKVGRHHTIVDLSDCLLAGEAIQKALGQVQ
jgi:hypothetical protein